MPKGMYTQCVCLLLDRVPTQDEVAAILAPFSPLGTRPAAEHWALSGPAVDLPTPDGHGALQVDVVDRPWPDDLGGDPQTGTLKDPQLMVYWVPGHLGPYSYPGNLERAAKQAWGWKGAANAAQGHTCFLRLRITYLLHGFPTVAPRGYDPSAEMLFLTHVLATLASLPGARAHFVPAGEVLAAPDEPAAMLARHRAGGPPPIDLWTNRRLWNIEPEKGFLGRSRGQWMLMDTVGMEQLDVSDFEACFEKQRYDPNEVARFLLNLSSYSLGGGHPFANGHTTDGPGGMWHVQGRDKPLMDPPRPVLRWLPRDGSRPPAALA